MHVGHAAKVVIDWGLLLCTVSVGSPTRVDGWLAGWLAGWMDGWMDGCIPVPPDALPLAPGYEKEHLLGRGACAAGGPRCFSFLGLTF